MDRPWETLLNRNVQHYGFEFNYRTLLLDYTKDTPPLPTDLCLQTILTRIQQAADGVVRQHQPKSDQALTDSLIASGTMNDMIVADDNLSFNLTETTKSNKLSTPHLSSTKSTTASLLGTYPLNQLTMNEYKPGQGIAHHVDSSTCFGPVICILSTAADISMTLAAKKSDHACRGGSTGDSLVKSGLDEDSAAGKATLNTTSDTIVDSITNPTTASHTVHMYVRRRSLMIFTQASRYTYTHGIASRRTDK